MLGASGGPNAGLSTQAPPKGACTRPKTSDGEGALLECSRSRLPGGTVLGTWEIHTKLPGGGQAVAARQATVAAPDGSVLTLFVTTVTTAPGNPPMIFQAPLPSGAPSMDQVVRTALAAASAWRSANS